MDPKQRLRQLDPQPQPTVEPGTGKDERMDTRQRLRRFIVEELQVKPEDVATDDSPLMSSQVIDSLGLLQIVSFLENEFEVAVMDDEMLTSNFETIGAIVRLLESKRG